MSPVANEWIIKAEGDFQAALILYRRRKNPNYDSTCFHSQQCVEKYLKGILQELNIRISKTHNLNQLLDLIAARWPLWEAYRQGIHQLTGFAVEIRYPGITADKTTAKNALEICKIIREAARKDLKIEE